MTPESGVLTLQVGGAINASASVYIVRPTDDILLQLLERGEYCNVLCSRQMGKTSLLKRTRMRLAAQGYATVEIDVAGYLGSPPDAHEWYQGLLQGIARQLGLAVDVRAWWQACDAVTPNQRLLQFFHDEVVVKATGRVVIFLDEIDSTLKLPYTDDFFVAIRSMYNDRASEPVYEKLTFCLVGVATPNELIKDPRTTPYNIGRTLELQDFDAEHDDLTAICRAVSDDLATGQAVVHKVLEWTGGHPFLTLRLCEEYIARRGASPEDVERIVRETFTKPEALRSDGHFQPILRFLQERADDTLTILTLYRRILAGKTVPDQTTPAHIQLKLMGLVKRNQHGLLVVRNPIYRHVFTDDWARRTMPAVERRVRAARHVALAAIVLLVLSPALWYELIYPRAPIETLGRVLDDYQVAQAEYRKLQQVPFYAGKADELLARFFERRALRAEQQEQRDDALLWRLKALAQRPAVDRARAVNDLIGMDYTRLSMTLRHAQSARGLENQWDRRLRYPNSLHVVALSPDGQTLVTGGLAGAARLWRVATGQPLGEPLRHDRVWTVAFSPDGQTLATGSMYKTAQLWRVATGQALGEPLGYGDGVWTVAFSPDGQTLVTGGLAGAARLWRVATGQALGEPLGYDNWVWTVAFSPDGQTLVTGSSDGTARLWRITTGQPLSEPLRHDSEVRTAVFSPDGQTLVTGSSDGTARLWRVTTGQALSEPLRHGDGVMTAVFSPDGQTLVTGSSDETAQLWRVATGQALGEPLRHDDVVWTVAFSPDGQTLATGGLDGTARLWRVATGQALSEPLRHGYGVMTAVFSPDGQTLVTGGLAGTARLWRVATGQPLEEPLRHDASVETVAFSPDGQTLVTGSDDKTARLWRVATGQALGEPLRHDDWVRTVAFSPDGQTLVTGSDDKTARLWRVATGQALGEPLRHDAWVGTVAFSPDGQTLATGGLDGTARLWRVATGQALSEPLRHGDWVGTVAFSPDGQTLVTGSDDKTARLWRVATGQPLGEPLHHDGSVRTVAFSPDGQTLVTGSDDKTARLWRVATGQPLGEPLHHDGSVRTVAFSPDGQTLVTATQWWMHATRLHNGSLQALASRLLPGAWKWQNTFFPLDPAAHQVRVAMSFTGGAVHILTLRLDQPQAEPLQGEPATLLADWQKRLGLRINEAGEIVPLYP